MVSYPVTMKGIAMFENPRYCTRGIQSTISLPLQWQFWSRIDNLPLKDKDWLHIFELKPTTRNAQPAQLVIHRQECPLYYAEYRLPQRNPLTNKIFVIDDGCHSVMMLADEY